MSNATKSEHALFRSPETSPETEEWLARVDALAPLVEEHRQTAEEQRETPTAVVDALREAGLLRMFVSREFGGSQVSLPTGLAVTQALARLDASVAWLVAVGGAIGRISDYLPEPVSRKLFKDNHTPVIGGVNPSGSAEVVDGGFRVSGRWVSASGYAHADWLVCTAFVKEGGEMRTTPDGGPEIRMMLLPKSETIVHDTWYTVGLRGTGSNDFSIEESFIPEEYTVPMADLVLPPAARPSRAYPVAIYDWPFGSSSTALGIAQDALAAFKAMAAAKTPSGGMTALSASHTTQEKLGRYEMLVRTAEVLLDDTARKAQEHGDGAGEPMTALIRLTAATVAEYSVAAVNGLYQLAGSSSLYATSRLERCFRDVNSVTKHMLLSPMHFETVGQYLLGGPLIFRR